MSFGFVSSQYVSQVICGKTTRDIFCIKVFSLLRPDIRVIYCNGLLYVFPTSDIFSFIISLLNCNIHIEGTV